MSFHGINDDRRAGPDLLDHGVIARQLLSHTRNHLPRGSVVSVEGQWGRGKTDVLQRTQQITGDTNQSERGPEPIVVNPWRQADSDLLTPVVVELMKRLNSEGGLDDRIQQLAKNLLRGVAALAVRGTSLVVPGGEIIRSVEGHIDRLVDGLLVSSATERMPTDPMSILIESFEELVGEYLSRCPGVAYPLYILVDDVDRCPPAQQVAALEALHFLTAADANCYFVVAINPDLVQQAVSVHYGTDAFDVERYLSKLFDLRLSLPPVGAARAGRLAISRLAGFSDSWEGFGSKAELESIWAKVCYSPSLANPRLTVRVVQRIRLGGVEPESFQLPSHLAAFSAIAWTVICERWPRARFSIQQVGGGGGDWLAGIDGVAKISGKSIYPGDSGPSVDVKDFVASDFSDRVRLPGWSDYRELGHFLSRAFETWRGLDSEELGENGLGACFRHCDDLFVARGL